jgi:hypothetical protein
MVARMGEALATSLIGSQLYLVITDSETET